MPRGGTASVRSLYLDLSLTIPQADVSRQASLAFARLSDHLAVTTWFFLAIYANHASCPSAFSVTAEGVALRDSLIGDTTKTCPCVKVVDAESSGDTIRLSKPSISGAIDTLDLDSMGETHCAMYCAPCFVDMITSSNSWAKGCVGRVRAR